MRPAALFALILFSVLAVACSGGGRDPVDPCTPNPCLAAHRGVCVPEGLAARCDCEAGYALENDVCVPEAGDPCDPNPCDQPHRGLCVDDQGQARCDCEAGYALENDACVPEASDDCPLGFQCRADVCVPDDLSAEQCLTDEDCHELDPGAPTVCNAAAAGGICLGCADDLDCPGASVCNPYAACALLCDADADCPHGRCYGGYCGQATCVTDADCQSGTACVDEDQSGSGLCLRLPCTELTCSPTAPAGLCPAGAICLYGACAAACDPNPCTGEPNRSRCELDADGLPGCRCDAGYEESPAGGCLPAACPAGWTCDNGVCADRDQPAFTCTAAADCGAGLACSTAVPGGLCSGCSAELECPADHTCLAGYCLRVCDTDPDCHPGTVCAANGYCSKVPCADDGDCDPGTTCTDTGSEVLCRAIACD